MIPFFAFVEILVIRDRELVLRTDYSNTKSRE